jgi:hypothetical protein
VLLEQTAEKAKGKEGTAQASGSQRSEIGFNSAKGAGNPSRNQQNAKRKLKKDFAHELPPVCLLLSLPTLPLPLNLCHSLFPIRISPLLS